jgi:hypothetical protein
MVALIVTVCAFLNGADCHDETFYFESHGTLNDCMYEAPLYLAQWGSTHPKWQIRRWTCDWPERNRQKT